MNEKTDDGAEKWIRKAYENLKEGNASGALGFLRKALEIDFEHQEVIYALKCLNWWLDKLKRLDEIRDPTERGEYILSQWKSYYGFLDRIGNTELSAETVNSTAALSSGEGEVAEADADSCQYALRCFIFTLALENFLKTLGDGSNRQDPVLLLQAGRCCKGAGNWDEALVYLEQAGRLKKDDSTVLSELADVKALLGDLRTAKVLFREAFFLDPAGIDLLSMESEIILALRNKVRDFGYTGQEIAEWIPVWGCIWGVFSVKRELKPVELGRLKQSILSLENELRSKNGGSPHIKPRLLNRYFWLIDHCEYSRDTSGLMDETMLKIKVIDPAVYKQYRS